VQNKKPTIAITSLTCCEGCQVAILDLGGRFLDLIGNVTIGDFALLEELPAPEKYDIVFVEGAPITEENRQRLYDLRRKSKILVALGACACLGGIAEIKDYSDKDERMRYVYKNSDNIQNYDIKSLKELVKVDLEIPGCPINNEEFLDVVKKLVMLFQTDDLTHLPKIPQRPVCYDCQLKQNECLLQKGLPCLGPIMLAGCGAPCPSSNYPCDGCRGPLKNVNPDNLNKQLIKQGYSQQEIDMILQRFGVTEEIYPNVPIATD
jgi:coenzyme F420-reducing hydrogenase gamma subunit